MTLSTSVWSASVSVSEEVEGMTGVKAAAPILEQPIVAVGPHGRRAEPEGS